MNKLFKFILPIGIVPILASCGGKPSSDVTHYVTFHQELADDVKVEFNSHTTDGEIIAQEPKIVAKDGYDAKWEDYTVVGKTADFTVNAVYDAYTYTVTFKQKGLIIDTVPFTAADVKGDHPQLPAEKVPACPSDTWYTYEWEDYELKLGDVVVNAISTGEATRIAKFTDGNQIVANNVKFSRKDVDIVGSNYKLKDSVIPDVVKTHVHDEEHPTYWDINWDFTIPTDAGTEVIFDANATKHNFKLQFVDFDGEQIGDLVNYQYDSTWESVAKPAVPSKTGYDVSWPDTVLSMNESPQVVNPVCDGHTYNVVVPGVGEKTAKFDSAYDFTASANPTEYLTYNGKYVPGKGIWRIPSDVTLEKKDRSEIDCSIDFEDNIIPNFLTTSDKMEITKDGFEGSNCLKVEIVAETSTDRKMINFNKDYLDMVFADSNVKAITFQAKANYVSSNFRARINGTNVTYENNSNGWGLCEAWKTFMYKREYYESWKEGDSFVIGWVSKGNTIYFDNFKTVTDDTQDAYGFECGGILASGANFEFRTPGHASTGTTALLTLQNGSGSDPCLEQPIFTSEKQTEGTTSLKFVKKVKSSGNQYSSYTLNGISSKIGADGYVDIDIYSTVAVNSTTTVTNFVDGNNNCLTALGEEEKMGKYQHPAGKWVTYRFTPSMLGTDRFLIIQGSSGGDWYFDNIRINPGTQA